LVELIGGVPHPGCFAKRGWNCLKTRELTFLETTKRPEEIDDEGDKQKRDGEKSGEWCFWRAGALAFENSRGMIGKIT
jgi:hypothetical protein